MRLASRTTAEEREGMGRVQRRLALVGHVAAPFAWAFSASLVAMFPLALGLAAWRWWQGAVPTHAFIAAGIMIAFVGSFVVCCPPPGGRHRERVIAGWLARAAWAALPEPTMRRRAVVPIWRKPWMACGSDTFTGAVLARLGIDNVLADAPERYPKFSLNDLPPHDLVVLPDEPYLFTADDGPESFTAPSALVSGRLLTWYGPSLVEAARVLPGALDVR